MFIFYHFSYYDLVDSCQPDFSSGGRGDTQYTVSEFMFTRLVSVDFKIGIEGIG